MASGESAKFEAKDQLGRFTIAGQALWDWRQQAIAQAQSANIDDAEIDWLLQGLCEIDGLSLRLGTLAHQPQVKARVALTELNAIWQQRQHDRTPIQYLVGQTPWRNFMLYVSPAVLIPRPETELMIDKVAAAVAASAHPTQLHQGTWVDLGTGSGAIALGLAQLLPQAQILAVDISPEALTVAEQNALAHGLSDRIQLLQGSWFEPLEPWRGRLTGVIANPPYIPQAIIPTLQPEVADHEPHLALDGGQDGLDCLDHLIQTAPAFLQPNGLWLVELMQGQAAIVMERLTQTGYYDDISACRDLAGIDRFVMARRR